MPRRGDEPAGLWSAGSQPLARPGQANLAKHTVFYRSAVGAKRMNLRIAIISLSLFDAAVLCFFYAAMWLPPADGSPTPSSNMSAADSLTTIALSLMFLVSAAPALLLAIRGRSLKTALILASAFPVALALLFIVALSWLPSLHYLS